MGLKHKKYVYVEIDKGRYAKLKVFNNKDENSADRYLVENKAFVKASRKVKILKLDDLPLEVKEKIREIFGK
ncbi:MAG: DUF5622 domain-containing protein [Metallosphaera sp.]|uniref:DUF5622 domain-containing protein n=1 Tax=Metallosphaera cuprina (strain Ar-4) TaxID=1006006 RepID=F4G0I8_METCR|nr:DUF5622 domain-containing protein [Metallosphaera cuprina]AEB94607.1 conserved hypothetical protein [Metallosphaera cuprina Ar-4]